MTCETVGELLLDYVEGELSPEQTRAVQAHLDACPACRAKVRETRVLLGDLGAARSAEEHVRNPAESHTQRLPAAKLEKRARIGDFEIISELGRGGMGVVYRARQLSLHRTVALKVLSAGLVQSERSVTRFAREAQAAARLHHTNIVPVYAQGQEGEYFYYAMELVDGQSLADALRAERAADEERTLILSGRDLHRSTTHRLSSAVSRLRSAVASVGLGDVTRITRPQRDFKRIVRLVAGVAEGLHHAHEQGVIHRDIKPQNLLLGPDDELHITDFGLARLLDEPGLTLSSEMVGTPAYMAPEQIVRHGEGVDRRTDVYALGVTLYEMLTLRRPFRGETYDQTIHLILTREPTPPRKIDSHIPQDLETICLRAIDKEPQRRFATAAELARDLRRWGEGFPISSRRIGPVGKMVRWVRRRPWRASALAALVFLVLTGTLALSFLSRWGNAEIDAAMTVLFDDYREPARALRALGWASRVGGDRYRRDLAEAFAQIRARPERGVSLLERALAERPDDPDAHYLLAWTYTRLMFTQGTARWADARQHVERGDELEAAGIRPSALGYFFRGQAVWGSDPKAAVETFERAINRASEEKRGTFMQAMLHQSRAMNQIMYSLRDRGYYQMAVGKLSFVVDGQPDKAYPRYLLSITHLLAAEIYLTEGKSAEAEEAYAACLAQARAAQKVEPSSPRGYAAEAGYHESRGDFVAAIDSWNRLDDDALGVRTSESDRAERYQYQMRLHFWLGEYAEAERMRKMRYDSGSGYNREHLDADESCCEALIAVSAGEMTRAEQALADGVTRARGRPEQRLRLEAACRVIGRAPVADLTVEVPDEASKLSPGWSREWLDVLTRYERGEAAWRDVDAAARRGIRWADDVRLRMAGAWFFRGVKELTSGERESAIRSLAVACDHHDNENYCFRAKLLLVKLQGDPDWPPWIASDGAAAP